MNIEPLHERAFLEVFEAMGYGASHGIHFPSYYGRSDKALWLDFLSKHNPPQPLDELMDWKQHRLLDILRQEQPIFETLPELVEKLSKRHGLALASGSLHVVIDAVLAMKNLRQYFPIRVSVEDVNHGKPAPDVFLRAAELLGVKPRNCCVIEDSAAGVQAARSADMQVIAITNTLPAERLAAATHIVETYEQIEKLLL